MSNVEITTKQREAIQIIRKTWIYDIHNIRSGDDGAVVLRHVGEGRERGTIRVREWQVDLDGGLTTLR